MIDINIQKAYSSILKAELVPAMGCTEPISIAYASSVAKKYLNQKPDSIEVGASGSLIKNVKSVIVPNSNGLKGIKASVAMGYVAGDSSKELEVISDVKKE